MPARLHRALATAAVLAHVKLATVRIVLGYSATLEPPSTAQSTASPFSLTSVEPSIQL